jgi:sugar porter (SP) family MFS transporter
MVAVDSSDVHTPSTEDVSEATESDVQDYVAKHTMSAKMSKPNGAMYVAIVTAMFGAIMFGIDTTNFGATVDFESFEEAWCVGRYGNRITCGHDAEHGASKNHDWLNNFVSWANLLIFVGAAFGAVLFGPPIATNLGRRPCISAGAAVTLVGCLMTSYLSFGSVPVFLVGRCVTGFGIGLCCFALPMYNAEISAPSIRGSTGSLFQLFVALGGLLAAVLTAYCKTWQVGMMLPGFAALIVMVAIWFTPESPRFVMMKEGYEAGLEQLKKVRIGDCSYEAGEMRQEIEREKQVGKVSYGALFTQRNLRKRVGISCWMQVAQQFTGMNAIIMYSGTLFREMGFENPLMTNLIFNCFMVVGMVIGLFLMDSRWGGRRSQLLSVTSIIGPLMIVAGFSITYAWNQTFTLFVVCLYALVWQMAWGMIPWVYPSEIFATSERDRAVSLAVFTQYGANAVLLYLVPVMQAALQIQGLIMFFGGFNLLNFLFVFAFVKETKGLPLENIPALFASKRRFRKWIGRGDPAGKDEGSKTEV